MFLEGCNEAGYTSFGKNRKLEKLLLLLFPAGQAFNTIPSCIHSLLKPRFLLAFKLGCILHAYLEQREGFPHLCWRSSRVSASLHLYCARCNPKCCLLFPRLLVSTSNLSTHAHSSRSTSMSSPCSQSKGMMSDLSPLPSLLK